MQEERHRKDGGCGSTALSASRHRCLIRLRSAICCTGERSAIATNDYVGKGSSHWCREFELARVISFDPDVDALPAGSIGKIREAPAEIVTGSTESA